jgi:hypothetical protein
MGAGFAVPQKGLRKESKITKRSQVSEGLGFVRLLISNGLRKACVGFLYTRRMKTKPNCEHDQPRSKPESGLLELDGMARCRTDPHPNALPQTTAAFATWARRSRVFAPLRFALRGRGDERREDGGYDGKRSACPTIPEGRVRVAPQARRQSHAGGGQAPWLQGARGYDGKRSACPTNWTANEIRGYNDDAVIRRCAGIRR